MDGHICRWIQGLALLGIMGLVYTLRLVLSYLFERAFGHGDDERGVYDHDSQLKYFSCFVLFSLLLP